MQTNLIKHSTKNLSERDWQILRQSFTVSGMTGGSDAGTLLGWNSYKSPVTLYYQSIGVAKTEMVMNIEMMMGKMQEDNIAHQWQFYDEDEDIFIQNVFSKNKPRGYKKEQSILINPDYPTLFANVDGIITKHPDKKTKGILEIKKINSQALDMYADQRPPQYVAQAQHYMLVLGLEYAELCMRVDGRKLVVHLLDRDKDIQQAIIIQSLDHQKRVMLFKEEVAKHSDLTAEDIYSIAAQFEPPADSSEDFKNFMSLKHRERALEKVIPGNDKTEGWVDQYIKSHKKITEAEKQKLLYGNRIRQYMERHGADVLNSDTSRVTWRKQFLVKHKF